MIKKLVVALFIFIGNFQAMQKGPSFLDNLRPPKIDNDAAKFCWWGSTIAGLAAHGSTDEIVDPTLLSTTIALGMYWVIENVIANKELSWSQYPQRGLSLALGGLITGTICGKSLRLAKALACWIGGFVIGGHSENR